jgi:hypothetical protein
MQGGLQGEATLEQCHKVSEMRALTLEQPLGHTGIESSRVQLEDLKGGQCSQSQGRGEESEDSHPLARQSHS